ncbi:hypothetical protein K435DRAFT_164046 [Dendrothele bispora CBS 962.96]|uniref:Uncharacterized protein n=1 Tax=Dendrothele bispora (strain CBS 962.96) TaxID=1314807 RepID=A0A4S8LXW9_DENBC|nr:hypothetical protein K435DRAFT_164046 [Dendrothele bispora CBS 962.96]
MRKREIGDGSNQGVAGGAGPSGFNGGAASGGNSGVGAAPGSGQVGQAKAEGLESLQAFDEEGRNVDGRRRVNRSGDALVELVLLLEKSQWTAKALVHQMSFILHSNRARIVPIK